MEQLESDLGKLTSSFETKTKEFELKLGVAERDAATWKELAEKKAQEVKDFEAKLATAKTDTEKAKAESKKAEIKAFVDAAKRDGRIAPASEEAVTRLMESMTGDATVATFDAKDGK